MSALLQAPSQLREQVPMFGTAYVGRWVFTTSTTWEAVAYRGKVILMTVDLSSETTEARMKAAKIISSVERKELSTQDPTFR